MLFFAQLHRILGGYGCLVVERTGSDVWAFLLSHDILWMHRVCRTILLHCTTLMSLSIPQTNVIVIKQRES